MYIHLAVLFLVNIASAMFTYLLRKIGKGIANWTLCDHKVSRLKSLVIYIIAKVQRSVSVIVARAVIFFHLLISGDVEQNPGPEQSECMSTVITF